jgi:hypothetical protein
MKNEIKELIEKSAKTKTKVIDNLEKNFTITVNTEILNYTFILQCKGDYSLYVRIDNKDIKIEIEYHLCKLYTFENHRGYMMSKRNILNKMLDIIEYNFLLRLNDFITIEDQPITDDPFKNIPFYNVKNDRSYLQGELIPLKESIISEDRICISASHTLYANIHLPKEKAGKEDLNILFKQVKKLAKDQKVRLNGQKRINDMLKNEEVFQLAHNEITDIYKQFQNLRRLYTIILERGLHMGTSEDILMEYTTIHKWKFEESTRQAKKFQLVNDTFKKLEEVKQDLLFNYDDDWKLTSIEI